MNFSSEGFPLPVDRPAVIPLNGGCRRGGSPPSGGPTQTVPVHAYELAGRRLGVNSGPIGGLLRPNGCRLRVEAVERPSSAGSEEDEDRLSWRSTSVCGGRCRVPCHTSSRAPCRATLRAKRRASFMPTTTKVVESWRGTRTGPRVPAEWRRADQPGTSPRRKLLLYPRLQGSRETSTFSSFTRVEVEEKRNSARQGRRRGQAQQPQPQAGGVNSRQQPPLHCPSARELRVARSLRLPKRPG